MLEAELIRKGELTERHAHALGFPIVILPDGNAVSFVPRHESTNLYTTPPSQLHVLGHTFDTTQEVLLSPKELRIHSRMSNVQAIFLEDIRS